MVENRDYRVHFDPALEQYQVIVGETDLAICLPPAVWDQNLRSALRHQLITSRAQLQDFISDFPDFAASHYPVAVPLSAPISARRMAAAAAIAQVGPMAAVAGYFAELAGRLIIREKQPHTVIVENGGDIFIHSDRERLIGIYAGKDNPFSGKIAVKISPEQLPCGVCTSSGTVGGSFSYGRADAAMIIAPDTALADAVASAAANLVQKPADVEMACEHALSIEGVTAAVIICQDQLAAAGAIELVRP
jgi:ApbE superfamily uncharacterized protein (UPF0280 family)